MYDSVQANVIESVASRLNGFFYRCQNDAGYTMLFMTDGVETMTGYPRHDFLNNRVRTFTSIMYPEDGSRGGRRGRPPASRPRASGKSTIAW